MSTHKMSAYRAAIAAAQHEVRLDAAPTTAKEHTPPSAPARVITQAMIDEWLANDPELQAWREAEARPRLW